MVEVSVYVLIGIPVAVIALVYVVSLFLIVRAPTFDVNNEHVLITGGSSGVGFAAAVKYLTAGANVTIVARDKTRLQDAKQKLSQVNSKRKVAAVSCDVGDVNALRKAVTSAVAENGPVTVFVGNAGITRPGHFEEISDSEFADLMQIHCLANVAACKLLVPTMKAARKGRIIFVASVLAQTGIYGYTAHNASKFALRGFAEGLAMELEQYNVYVTVVCPADIDTPMLARENLIKPIECRLISEGTPVVSADAVANVIVDSTRHWRHIAPLGLDGHLLAMITAGTAPAHSALTLTIEFIAAGTIRFMAMFYRYSYAQIVKNVMQQRVQGKVPTIGNSNDKTK